MRHLDKVATVPMPPRIARLPKDKRGYPIPWTVEYKDGVPDFTTIDQSKWFKGVQERRCGVCGEVMHQSRVFFIGGPLCYENRLFFDHPMHEECATYALQVCAYLALPKMTHRRAESSDVLAVLESASVNRPDKFMLGRTRKFQLARFNNDILMLADPWESVVWWKNGELMKEEVTP